MKKKLAVVVLLVSVSACFVARQVFSVEESPRKPKEPPVLRPEFVAAVEGLSNQNKELKGKIDDLTRQVSSLKEQLQQVRESSATADYTARNAGAAAQQSEKHASLAERRAIDAFSEAQKASTSALNANTKADVLKDRFETHRHQFKMPQAFGGVLSYFVRNGAEIQTPDH